MKEKKDCRVRALVVSCISTMASMLYVAVCEKTNLVGIIAFVILNLTAVIASCFIAWISDNRDGENDD